jgi:hypothetical protein
MATDKVQFQAKSDRAHAARIKSEAFVAAGGDLRSKEAAPLGLEMIQAWNDLSTEFGQPTLNGTHLEPAKEE